MDIRIVAFAFVLTVTIASSFGIISLEQVEEQIEAIIGAKIDLEDRLEAITKKSHSVNDNFRWEETKAAGFILNEKNWEVFSQICERLVLEFWNFRVYMDVEARIMWTYTDPSNPESEIYYVQFTD